MLEIRIKPDNNNPTFDFPFTLYIPENATAETIDKCMLVSFDQGGGREKYLAENVDRPVMNIFVSKQDQSEKEANVDKYSQLSPEGLVDSNGKRVPYLYGKSGIDMASQYTNAIEYAKKYLMENKYITEDASKKVDVEGYSANGVIAQRYAMLYPENVRSVIVGGAISSIPIPLTKYNGETLEYPTGFADIELYTGKTPEKMIAEYKKIKQIEYATEYELRYDGNFTQDGTKIERDESGKRIAPRLTSSCSSHDISPDVVCVVKKQMKIFKSSNINERIAKVKEILTSLGIDIHTKIYEGTDHHSENPETIEDMKYFVESLDEGGQVRGFEPDYRDGKEISIDISFQEKREEIYERVSNGETYEEILNSMSLEDINRFFRNGSVKNKPFIKNISDDLIDKAIGVKQQEFDRKDPTYAKKEVITELETNNFTMKDVIKNALSSKEPIRASQVKEADKVHNSQVNNQDYTKEEEGKYRDD